MPLPFILVTTKPNKQKIEVKLHSDTGTDLEDIQKKLIYIIQEQISVFNDIPDNYNDFIYKCWYQEHSADAEPFVYKIFKDDEWITPWTIDELYESVYEILHKLELLAGYINDANKNEESDEDNEAPAEAEMDV